ncbi:MAG: DUF2141 domain-containing protein [Bacteroidetes bacterium]|nr:DUF2141 domain-containing protein [Bacteroidota bacterium]
MAATLSRPPFPLDPASPVTPAERTATLTVEVEHLRNAKGRVQFALYDRDGTIPDEHFQHWYKLGTAPITDGKATYTFTNLPPGRYAVNILHDEDANGKIDKGLILPKEGIGFSNYTSVGPMNRPNFKKASFAVEGEMRVLVKMIYL